MPDYNHIKNHERNIVSMLNGITLPFNKTRHISSIVDNIKRYFPKTTKYELINSNHSIPGDIIGYYNSQKYHIELKLGNFTTEAQTTASILGPHYGNWNDVNPRYLATIRQIGFKSLLEFRNKLRNLSDINRSDPRFQWTINDGIKTPTLHPKIVRVTNELKNEFLIAAAPYMDVCHLTNYFNRVRRGYTKFVDPSVPVIKDNVDYYIVNHSGIYHRRPIYKPSYKIIGSEIHFFCSRNDKQYVRLRPHWKNRGQGGLNPCFMVWMEPPERLA